VRSGG